jgi:uncharacterized protein YdhG (YjbR/CyaY superfamily)
MSDTPAAIEQYIASFPEDVQRTLKELRQKIAAQLPDAEQVISYGIPTFKRNGKYIVYFSGWKDHISIHPFLETDGDLLKELEPYKSGRGTLRFPLDRPLPYDLIKKVVEALDTANHERTGQ